MATADTPSITQFGHAVAMANAVMLSLVFNSFNIMIPHEASITLRYAVRD